MKKKAAMLLSSLALVGLLTACSSNNQPTPNATHGNMDHSQMKDSKAHGPANHDGMNMDHGAPTENQTKAVWKITNPQAKQNTNLTIDIQDNAGKPIEKFDISHEKDIHLIVVSKDLSYFDHIHPEYKGKGEFQINYTFPSGGEYELIADYKPTNAQSETQKQWIKVEGDASAQVAIQPDKELTKVIDGKEVTLNIDNLAANKELNVTFTFKDAKTKQSITNLQPYLGAVGHIVILDKEAQDYLHVHPTDEKSTGPDAKFMTTFPKSGVYKIWGQFQQDGKVFAVPFIVNVP
jgi:hypothetical protein